MELQEIKEKLLETIKLMNYEDSNNNLLKIRFNSLMRAYLKNKNKDK